MLFVMMCNFFVFFHISDDAQMYHQKKTSSFMFQSILSSNRFRKHVQIHTLSTKFIIFFKVLINTVSGRTGNPDDNLMGKRGNLV